MLGKDEIENRFSFHKAALESPEVKTTIHAGLRKLFVAFAETLDLTLVEDSREKKLAMTALEEASMWSHKAIAKDNPLIDED